MILKDAQPMPFPVQLKPWMIAEVDIRRDEARGLLNQPHYIETDGQRTDGGDEDIWGFEFPSGMRIVVQLGVS